MNALVKCYVTFQKQDVLCFVNDLKKCVQEQQNETNKATNGLGRWKLSPNHHHVARKTSDWFGGMTRVEKQDSLLSLHPSSSTQKTSATSSSRCETEALLSVPFTSLCCALFSTQLEAMWRKASRLLLDKKVIKPPHSNPKTRWVVSDTDSSPHVVTTTKSNPRRYICDKQCLGWKCCAHCIASAEDNGDLDVYLAWFASSKGKECTLSDTVYHAWHIQTRRVEETTKKKVWQCM